jgi:rod shape-determining protein MreD
MALKKTKVLNTTVIITFFLATMALLLQTAVFPSIRLIFYIPFLIFLYFNSSFISSLWISALVGLMVDSFSSTPFGIYAINYSILTAILYKEKRFFNEKPLSISLFTVLMSMAFSIIHLILLFIFDKPLSITAKWILTDLFIMPIIDGLYAFIWFVCPIKIFEKIKKLAIKKI